MTIARIPRDAGVSLYARTDGLDNARTPVLILAHELGFSSDIWDPLLPHLPANLRILRWDGRGQGKSSVPQGPYKMGTLVSDAAAVCDFLGIKDAVMLGHGAGGVVAQGLTVKRLDLVRGLILSHTAARLSAPGLWQRRADQVRATGMGPVMAEDGPKFFARDFKALEAEHAPRLLDADPEGYAATCEALAGADFYTTTASLRLSALGIAGTEDRVTPPDLVRETVDLIPGADFVMQRRRGHFPWLEDPAGYAATLTDFLYAIAHIPR